MAKAHYDFTAEVRPPMQKNVGPKAPPPTVPKKDAAPKRAPANALAIKAPETAPGGSLGAPVAPNAPMAPGLPTMEQHANALHPVKRG